MIYSLPIFGDMDLVDYEQVTIMNFGVPQVTEMVGFFCFIWDVILSYMPHFSLLLIFTGF